MIIKAILGGALLASPLPLEYNMINRSIYSIGSIDLGVKFDATIKQDISFFVNENNEVSGIEFNIELYDNQQAGFNGSTKTHIVNIASVFEQNISFNNLISFTTETSVADVTTSYIALNLTYYFNWQNGDNVITFLNTLYLTMNYSAPIESAIQFETTNIATTETRFYTGDTCPTCAPCDTGFFSFMGSMFNSTIEILNFEIFDGFKLWYILGIPLFISLIFGVLKLLR